MVDWLRNLFREELTDTQKSALLLDRKHPGWAEKIDLTTLVMWDADNCVLSQLYGNYTEGLAEVGLDSYAKGYNFMLGTDSWKKEVLARR